MTLTLQDHAEIHAQAASLLALCKNSTWEQRRGAYFSLCAAILEKAGFSVENYGSSFKVVDVAIYGQTPRKIHAFVGHHHQCASSSTERDLVFSVEAYTNDPYYVEEDVNPLATVRSLLRAVLLELNASPERKLGDSNTPLKNTVLLLENVN